MFDSVINVMDKFGPEILVIQFGLLTILSTIFLWLWFANRRKYHNLKHAIPANVVKSYLDSIIQNSNSLKSQLFRGGGLDVKNGVPSVLSLQDLAGDGSVGLSGAPSTALIEELNQKKAQIALLESQNSSLKSAQSEFETKIAQNEKIIFAADAKITELERIIEQLKSEKFSEDTSAMEDALKSELQVVTKERDELKEALQEYSLIGDDIANLKKLKEENRQLKLSLNIKDGQAQAEPEAEPMQLAEVNDLLEDISDEPFVASASLEEDNKALEEFLSSPVESAVENEIEVDQDLLAEAMAEFSGAKTEVAEEISEIDSLDEVVAAAEPEEDKKKDTSSTDDLLSEFEKMLG